jgi:hypothetical protein
LSKDKEGALSHLTTVVEICGRESANRYIPVNALIDSGATYNFVFHAVAERLYLKPVAGKAPPAICTIDRTRIQVHGIY